jgi:hypothetical protein
MQNREAHNTEAWADITVAASRAALRKILHFPARSDRI